jgi:hypothetical protein
MRDHFTGESIMKKLTLTAATLFLLFSAGIAFGQDSTRAQEQNSGENEKQVQNQNAEQNQEANGQQQQHGMHFVDEDGDGYNDNAPDQDGDGIPNGLDPDFVGKRSGFVDLDGDGINDNVMRGRKAGRGMRGLLGPGNGVMNRGRGNADGGPDKGMGNPGQRPQDPRGMGPSQNPGQGPGERPDNGEKNGSRGGGNPPDRGDQGNRPN